MSIDPGLPPPAFRRHWSDVLVAVFALALSAISLWVAVGTEEANRKMVAAASWPLLQVESSNTDQGEKARVTLSIANSGVGPAKLETMEVFWKGKAYRSSFELVRDCCGFQAFTFPQPAGEPFHTPMTTGTASGVVIRAGESRMFLSLPLGTDNDKVWRALDRARRQFRYRACYCSVFDECWVSTLQQLDAVKVDKCPAVGTLYTQ